MASDARRVADAQVRAEILRTNYDYEGSVDLVTKRIASLPFSGAQTAHFSFDLSAKSLLEGHVRALEWLGGLPRECVYDNLRSVVGAPRRPPDSASSQ